jgi:hypothetical protein
MKAFKIAMPEHNELKNQVIKKLNTLAKYPIIGNCSFYRIDKNIAYGYSSTDDIKEFLAWPEPEITITELLEMDSKDVNAPDVNAPIGTIYCPLCHKSFFYYKNTKQIYCYECNRHIHIPQNFLKKSQQSDVNKWDQVYDGQVRLFCQNCGHDNIYHGLPIAIKKIRCFECKRIDDIDRAKNEFRFRHIENNYNFKEKVIEIIKEYLNTKEAIDDLYANLYQHDQERFGK